VKLMASHLTDLPEPHDRAAPRYSRRPFPAYRYVPGLHPHPNRDPSGHSYQPRPTPSRHAPWRVDDWRTLDDWLYGVDLFNHFYFWEAHEAWEGLWAATGREAAPALMLQGLIQIAAALLKTHMGVVAGARTLSSEGLDKLRRAAAAQARMLGLDLDATVIQFARYCEPLARGVLPRIGPAVPVLQLAE
jgi:hypothetical protein